MAKKILLDTDIGTDSDDALALALAMASPEIEIAGVIATGTEAGLRARIAKKILVLGGRGDIPVYVGASEPVGEGALYWFGHEGQGIIDDADVLDIEAEPGVDAYTRLTREHDGLEVVAIGSMSTVASALDADVGLADRLGRIVIMGGHVRPASYGGIELSPGIDYNLCSDPEASARTVLCGAEIVMVPCEVTVQTWITTADTDRIEASGGLGAVLAAAVRAWTPMQQAIFAGLGCDPSIDNADFMHDPLTVASCQDESFCTFEDTWLEPKMIDGVFRTIEVEQNATGAAPVRLATAVDNEGFQAHLAERL